MNGIFTPKNKKQKYRAGLCVKGTQKKQEFMHCSAHIEKQLRMCFQWKESACKIIKLIYIYTEDRLGTDPNTVRCYFRSPLLPVPEHWASLFFP